MANQPASTTFAAPVMRGLSRVTTFVLTGCLLMGVLAPSPAVAHVKWFAEEHDFPMRTDLIVSDRTLLALMTATLAVVALTLVERWVRDTNWPNLAIFRRMAVGAPTILALQAAIALVASAAQGTLLAPNFPMSHTPLGVALLGVELFVAITFITGILDWVGALALIALLPLGAIVCGPWDVVEQGLWLGIATVVLVIGRSSTTGWRARPWFQRRDPAWTRRAVAMLRVTTGLTFIALAVGEKLWNPDLGRAFLVAHPTFNVLHSTLGLSWFSDDLFVLLVGLTEATIGALLISGRLTRVVVLAMWLPFHLGIPLLPAQELIGHLPIFGIMYLLLVHGSGAHRAMRRPEAAPLDRPIVAKRPLLGAAAVIVHSHPG